MAIEEIERLKEKLAKDPDSKLFVPLAEEYKKAGMLDEAVDVLTKGLETQPSYLSARVSLGKIYIDRGMLDEARAEFEKVITVIPDNLYAHKKLAEISKDLGEKDNAIREFKTVLRLNPADEWAATGLSSIEQETVEIPRPAKEEAEMLPPQDESLEAEEESSLDAALTARDLEISKILSEEGEEERVQEEEPLETSFKGEETEIWNAPFEPADETKEAVSANPFSEAETDLLAAPSEQAEEILEKPSEISFGGMAMESWGAPEQSEVAEEREIPAKTTLSEEEMELWKTHLEAVGEMDVETEEGVIPIEAGESLSSENIVPEPAASLKDTFVNEQAIHSHPVPSENVADADKWIVQGKYGEAMNIYRNILSADPGDRRVLQRIEELRSLLKLLGKDKELITRLEHLLEGIKKRRSEFSGTA